MTVYVDGLADVSASLVASGPLRNNDGSDDPLIIGGLVTGGGGPVFGLFQGLIDDVAYYNRALSDAEVQAIYSAPLCSVNNPPTMTNPGDQTNAEGDSVSLQLTASDPHNDALTYSAIGLPPGLSVNPTTGLVSGLLDYDSAGTYQVTASVSDSTLSASATFNWLVTNTNRPPALSNPSDQTSHEGDSISLQLTATDPDGDALTFEAEGLPPGFSINPSSGQITKVGVPHDQGQRSVAVDDGKRYDSTVAGGPCLNCKN